jgi:hypothetical protein
MTTKFSQQVSRVKTIRQGETDFMLRDGIVSCPRAGFEISTRCPKEYRQILMQAMSHGWIKPVAHVMDSELMWDRLSEQSNETVS